VHECVLGLLASPRQDFEVVVRDNCSTDNTLELLNSIRDDRLKIHCAHENQGILTFYEASKLATGNIVTWLSDEDSFQFEKLDFILDQFRRHPDCNVMFGGIIVGSKAREVRFPEAIVTDAVQAYVTALSFSGCGGLFVRGAALPAANTFDVRSFEDAYALWNYYPVGFFASRCLDQSLKTTSKIVVIQTRFAQTTNNWSKLSPTQNISRVPHYYPDSVFDRLASNIANIFSKHLPLRIKFRVTMSLIYQFRLQAASFSNSEFHRLLRENYSDETVNAYLEHIECLGLNESIGRNIWTIKKIVFSLSAKLRKTRKYWHQMAQVTK
jgi:glycosyltransferase involved in cell wall biosynthesis